MAEFNLSSSRRRRGAILPALWAWTFSRRGTTCSHFTPRCATPCIATSTQELAPTSFAFTSPAKKC